MIDDTPKLKKHQVQCMFRGFDTPNSSMAKKSPGLEDLPDEILLKILSYLRLEVVEKFSKFSKRWYQLSIDESLWKCINIWGRDKEPGVPAELIYRALCLGTKFLSLSDCLIVFKKSPEEYQVENKLKYLNLDSCTAVFGSSKCAFEEMFTNCKSLEKLTLVAAKDWNFSPQTIEKLVSQNSKTLTVLGMYALSSYVG